MFQSKFSLVAGFVSRVLRWRQTTSGKPVFNRPIPQFLLGISFGNRLVSDKSENGPDNRNTLQTFLGDRSNPADRRSAGISPRPQAKFLLGVNRISSQRVAPLPVVVRHSVEPSDHFAVSCVFALFLVLVILFCAVGAYGIIHVMFHGNPIRRAGWIIVNL